MANKLIFLSTTYFPPPTDAVLLNPDGTVNGPANPALFSSPVEAHKLVANLIETGIIPKPKEIHHILDEPNTEDGTVRYGRDGRKILVLMFERGGFEFKNNVQELYTELMRFPSPGSVWAIELGSDGDEYLIRKGAVVGLPA